MGDAKRLYTGTDSPGAVPDRGKSLISTIATGKARSFILEVTGVESGSPFPIWGFGGKALRPLIFFLKRDVKSVDSYAF